MHNYAGQASFGLRYHIVQKVRTVYLHNSVSCAHEQEVNNTMYLMQYQLL